MKYGVIMEIFLFLIWLVSIVIGVSVGSKKGEGCLSLIMCFLLGPLWLPIVFLSNGNRKPCPFCKELINKDAIICPHCRNELRSFNRPDKSATLKKCPNCSEDNQSGAKFCENCGTKLN